MPVAIEISNPYPLRNIAGNMMKSNIEGMSNQSMLSERSATLAVSFVSRYNIDKVIILVSGNDTNKAPNTVVRFANSLPPAIIAPPRTPFHSRLSNAMKGN